MSGTDRTSFGFDTTTTEALEGIDVTGKLVLVTGASGGLGTETARALASKGAHVVMTARNLAKGAEVVRTIKDSTGNVAIELEELELSSLASIRAFADRFLSRHDSLQILVNNAGVMACPLMKTEDGFEMQFGTNHLGHFLLTGLLGPALVRGAPARAISVSSRGHHLSPVVFDDINYEQRPYDKWLAYGQSKTANVLSAIELERRLGSRGVHSYAVHPGAIRTDLLRHMEPEDLEMLNNRIASGVLKLKTVEAGAATTLFAATAPELEGRGGLYLEDCSVAEVNDAENAPSGVRSYAIDEEIAKQLWSVSEEMVGESLLTG